MTTIGKGYAGDGTALDAYDLPQSRVGSVLVDVPSEPEWSHEGAPDVSGLDQEVVLVEWQRYPTTTVNDDFVPTLLDEFSRSTPCEASILFMCRSGARSQAAARVMSEQGFTNRLDVAGGFEGPLDAERHRGRRDGWKAQDLPWRQN